MYQLEMHDGKMGVDQFAAYILLANVEEDSRISIGAINWSGEFQLFDNNYSSTITASQLRQIADKADEVKKGE